jgi:hypothetical protein
METTVTAPPARAPRAGVLVAASLLGVLGLMLLAAGVAGLWARIGTTDHGYITSASHRYAADGRAIVTGALDADGIPDWLVGKLRVSASSSDGRALFVGVGRRADVDRYLAGVAHSTVEDVNFDPFAAAYSSSGGTRVPARPAAQSFWAESQVGTGTQTVSWKLRSGNWRVVVMNADGSPHVAANAEVGASIEGALAIAISFVGVGVALAGLAGLLVLRSSRRP